MQFLGIGFLVLLFLEIMSIVWVADWLGGGITLFLMAAGFITGIYMLRRIGMSGVLLAAATMRSGGEISLYQLLWPIRYALAAILLISPGFASTTLALLLLLPIKGKPITQTGTDGNVHFGGFGTFQQNAYRPQNNDEDIIEGEFTVDSSTKQPKQLTDQTDHRA
ncbi:MAG: FxsA family protein [Neisseria sp.]|nr:FxsA family protein [Neisseria sp.]